MTAPPDVSPTKRPFWETLDPACECERCDRAKAAVHLEFEYSGHWSVCARCAAALKAYHAQFDAPAPVVAA